MTDDPTDDSLRRKAWQGIADAIRAGGYQPGDRLPPEREFAERLDVSRSTLRLALHDLERAGVVVRRPGRGGGTFVATPKVELTLETGPAKHGARPLLRGSFAGLGEYIRRQGLAAGARVISVALTGAEPVVAEALRLAPGDPVIAITRVRLADGEPIALERSRFPADRFPGLAEQALGGSLYELLTEKYGEKPGRAVERIEPVAATPEAAALLDVAAGTPLLAVERVAYDQTGVPIEHADDLFRGDRTSVVVWTSPGEESP